MILRLKQRGTEGFDPGILQQIGLAVDELVVMRCELARGLQLLPIDQQQVVIDVDLLGVSLLEVAKRNQIPGIVDHWALNTSVGAQLCIFNLTRK